MKPLLAHVYEPNRVTYPCYVQPKLNGIRALYQAGRFQSRDQLPFPEGLLNHLAEPLRKLFPADVILDGELYHHGWPLQRINAAVTPVRQKPIEDTLQVEYHVFDRVHFELSFMERFHEVCTGIDYDPRSPIQFVATCRAETQVLGNILYAEFVSQGYEGMMYRLGDCPYTVPKQHWEQAGPLWNVGHKPKGNFISDKDNRCWHLLKRKDWQDDEFVCAHVIEGEGKLLGTLGAIKCTTKQGAYFNVGSGLTDSERAHYWVNPPIGKLIKVKYLVLSNDGIPLNPTILAIL